MEQYTVGIENAALKNSPVDNSVTNGNTTNNYYGNDSSCIYPSEGHSWKDEINFKEALKIASLILPKERVVAHFDAEQGTEQYLPLLIEELTTVLYDLADEIYKAYPERRQIITNDFS